MSKRKPTRTHTGPPVIDLYARISHSTDDTRGMSVEGQVEDGQLDIVERGGVVGMVFRDESKSAWNPKVDRPEFNQLMARLEGGESRGVWVRELTRFSRKIIEGERLVTVADQGATVWSLDNDYDLTKAAGRRHFREDMVTAANESDTISERTTRGKLKKARRGKSNASHRGFAMPGFLPNPPEWETGDPRIPVPDKQLAAEREAVQALARMLLDGESWASMVRYLNGTDLRTMYGNTWSVTAVRLMMKRPSLGGILVHQGSEVGVLPGEPVLAREVWDRCQSVMASRPVGRAPSERYLLTGLIVCGRCGHSLTGRPRVSRSPYADGTVAREYWCQRQSGRGSGCGQLSIDQRFADAVVERAVLRQEADPRHVDRLNRQAVKVQTARDKLTAEATRLQADVEGLALKVAAWGLAAVEVAMTPLTDRLAVVHAELTKLDIPERLTASTADAAKEWSGTVDQKRAMIRRAFPKGITIETTALRGRAARSSKRFTWTS